jgi:hypothetical protein
MIRATTVIMAVGAAAFGSASASLSQTAPGAAGRVPPELAAQPNPRPARARTRIRVTPAYPYRTFSTTYPVPYTYEYPGPGFVRQCAAWLRPENRPSGPVITPQMRCWWEPGS